MKETVSGALDNYEIRPSQIEMMYACSRNIEKCGTLMTEAGTGTGKTFAYLIPIILSGKKAIVSTKTINLQEQLVSKDLKFLSELIDFSYAIAKGRANYLCLRRLNAFRTEDQKEAEEYRNMAIWASDTDIGDLEDLDIKRVHIWDKICSDSDACKGMKCSYYRQCFYFRARQRWEMAQIIVANHALIGINSMLIEKSKILPEAEVLIIDEAHALDRVLSEVIGSTLSNKGFENILNRLLKMDERGHYKGLLSKSPHLSTAIESLRSEMGLLWTMLRNEFKDRDKYLIKGVFKFSDTLTGLSEAIESLITAISTSVTGLFEEDEEIELVAAMTKLKAFSEGIEEFAHESDGYVRWIEIGRERIALRIAPIYPRDFVLNNIMPQYQSMILTSATLSVSGDFGFISHVLGLKEADKVALPSPFDLRNQVTIEIKRGIDFKKEGGVENLSMVVIEDASKKDGGMLVLFTSREVMNKTWDLCHEELKGIGLNPMIQGELPNRTILQTMRESENSIIFGLDSFWEGVDVKGDALKCLIITKLPFEVPTEPIVMARTELIEREGGNPFYEYSLPRAVLKFKQGFGRLIRSKTDRGRIIICDERIETMTYGRMFRKILFQ
ncbi:MAG: DEAD/DEAH box helicase [Nitrospirae bacterium]|nr:DEAD/DEAH box helicase [Nitrospirota bacterium]